MYVRIVKIVLLVGELSISIMIYQLIRSIKGVRTFLDFGIPISIYILMRLYFFPKNQWTILNILLLLRQYFPDFFEGNSWQLLEQLPVIDLAKLVVLVWQTKLGILQILVNIPQTLIVGSELAIVVGGYLWLRCSRYIRTGVDFLIPIVIYILIRRSF